MWPWEHAALGYLLYSLALRALGKEPPSDAGMYALLFGTQLPDIIDKPLAWGFDVFPSGYALGHSVFLAFPAGVLAVAVGIRTGRPRLGVAFAVGYWSHLVSDALNPLRYGGSVAPDRLLWPLIPGTPYEDDLGLGRGVAYLGELVESLGSTDPLTLLVAYLLLPLGTLALWLYDGGPGLTPIVRLVRSGR